MSQPVTKIFNGHPFIAIAGPFDDTDEDKAILGPMILLLRKKGTKYHVEKVTRRKRVELWLYRTAEGYKTGEDPQNSGKRKAVKGDRGIVEPVINKKP